MGVCQVSFGILPGHRKNLFVLLTVLHPQWPNPSNKRLMDLSKPMNGRKWKTKHCDVQFVNPNVHTKYIHTNSYNCRQSIRCNYTYTRACVYNIYISLSLYNIFIYTYIYIIYIYTCIHTFYVSFCGFTNNCQD